MKEFSGEKLLKLRAVDWCQVATWRETAKIDPAATSWLRVVDCIEHRNGNCTVTVAVAQAYLDGLAAKYPEWNVTSLVICEICSLGSDICGMDALRSEVDTIPIGLLLEVSLIPVEWSISAASYIWQEVQKLEDGPERFQMRRYGPAGRETVQLELYPPIELYRRIRAAAGGSTRPPSDLVYTMVTEWLERRHPRVADDEIPF